jgi:hypothetical protein
VGERGRLQIGLLREVVPLAQHHRVARARLVEEAGRLIGAEHAALQREAALGIVAELGVVVGVGLAEIALRVDVQLDRIEHGVREQAAQERYRVVLVRVVDAAQRGRVVVAAALVVQQMAEVVQQAGRHQFVARARLLGEVRCLQRMFELRHRLAAVLAGAVAAEKQFDVGELEHGGLVADGKWDVQDFGASSCVDKGASCEWRIRVLLRAPADSRIG